MCNTTAFHSANKQSDIDLFVVTNNETLWISRVFLTLFTQIFGIRRHGNKIANRFCLSFFATEKGAFNLQDLEIKKAEDPYFAIWTATLIPVLIEQNFLKIFQEQNKWIENYGLKFPKTRTVIARSTATKQFPMFQDSMRLLRPKGTHRDSFFTLIEKLLKCIFLPRTQKKAKNLQEKSGTIISDDYLKFHNKDVREEIAKALQ